MPQIPNIGLSFADSTAQNLNPFSAFQSGGNVFAPVRLYGSGTNNAANSTSRTQTPSQSATTNQTPTATASTFGGPVAAPAVPFADGPLGWLGGGYTTPAVTSPDPLASSLVLPAAILGAALLVVYALRK